MTFNNVMTLTRQLKIVRNVAEAAEAGSAVLTFNASAAVLDSCATELEKIAKSLRGIAGERREQAGIDALRTDAAERNKETAK